MKIAKLSVVLEKRDFREWVTQYLRSVVPDSVAISSVALDGLAILIKGRADVGVIKHDFEAAFEMSPAKDGDALLLKLKPKFQGWSAPCVAVSPLFYAGFRV